MKGLVRLARLWNWLPAFRAVAETERLPAAGEALGVSAPALSRSIKLLEQDLGHELFQRSGRNLRLNPRGRLLLRALRVAMRVLDDAVEESAAGALHGTVTITALGAATTARVLPALRSLKDEHPGFVPSISSGGTDLAKRLVRGEVEISFQSQPLGHPELQTTSLGSERSSVWCAPGHPLAEVESVKLEEVVEHEFLGPPADPSGRVPDFWPEDHPRRIGLTVDQMRIGRDACLATGLLAVLPDVVAEGSGLIRLPLEGVLPPTAIYATHRRDVGPGDPAALILEAVRLANA